MIWHVTWRLGQAAWNYKIINLQNIKSYKYTHLTKCLQSAFYFHNYNVKPSIKFLFTKYRVNKFINQWQRHRFTWTSIIFNSNIQLLVNFRAWGFILNENTWFLFKPKSESVGKCWARPQYQVTGVKPRGPGEARPGADLRTEANGGGPILRSHSGHSVVTRLAARCPHDKLSPSDLVKSWKWKVYCFLHSSQSFLLINQSIL